MAVENEAIEIDSIILKSSAPDDNLELQPSSSTPHIDQRKGPATRLEVWSYYSYFAANNGIGSYQYANFLFQNLIYQAGFNPKILPLGSSPCTADTTAPCHVFWNGGTEEYTSVILIATALTFVFQSFIFVGIGSLADFGNWNPWVVRGFSFLCWVFQFGFLGVRYASQWKSAMVLYILSSVTWWSSFVFFNAIFPKLAHDLPEYHEAGQKLESGLITEEEYQRAAMMARSKIMNISWMWSNFGYTACGALSLAALIGLGADDSVAQNNWGYSVSVAVTTGFWIIFAIPWFFWEKRRPGPPLPKEENYLTFGFKQTFFAARQVRTLSQTLAYLIASFLLQDGLTTTLTLVAITQNEVVVFSAIENTYLSLVSGVTSIVGVYCAYRIQRYYDISTKTMLQATNFGSLLLALWGIVGIWTTRFGYRNVWEFWAFAVVYGFTIGIEFSYAQAFMAELVPKGREYMFFSLLGIVSRGSAWIGPVVCSAIVDINGNQWTAFPFVSALIFFPFVGIFFISEEKSRRECAEYLRRERIELRKVETDETKDL